MCFITLEMWHWLSVCLEVAISCQNAFLSDNVNKANFDENTYQIVIRLTYQITV